MATRRLGGICKHDSHLPYTTDFLAPGESALEVETCEVQRIFLRHARYTVDWIPPVLGFGSKGFVGRPT